MVLTGDCDKPEHGPQYVRRPHVFGEQHVSLLLELEGSSGGLYLLMSMSHFVAVYGIAVSRDSAIDDNKEIAETRERRALLKEKG